MAGPQIEQYGDRRVAARPIDAPLVNPSIASPAAFGAPIAAGVRDATLGIAQANKLRQEEEDKRDEVQGFDGYNEYLDNENKRRADYFNRTGKNALDLPKVAREDHEKSRDAIAAKLTTPGAREKFLRLTDRRFLQTDAQVQSHTAEQVKKYTADTYNGTIDRLGLDALDDGSPEALEAAERQRMVTRQRQGELLGTPGSELEVQHRQDAAKLYGAAVESRIDADDWRSAKDLLDRYGSKLDPTTRADLQKRVRSGGLNQEAQNTADTIFRSGYANTKADADRMVAAIEDADLRDRTQTKVDQEWNRREKAIAEARGKAFEQISAKVDAGEDVEALIEKHRDRAALTQEDKDRLRVTAERAADRKAPPTGSDSYYLLRNAAAVAPDRFMGEDLRLWRGRISEPERQRLMELQADMRAAGTTRAGKEKAPRGFMSTEAIANETLRGMDINPNLEDGEIDPRALAFKAQFDAAVEAAGGDDKLSATDLRRIALRLTAEEVRKVDRGIFNPLRWVGDRQTDVTVRAFEAPGAARRAFSVGQIPAADLPRVVEALKRAGKDNPTEDQILSTYNATVSKAAE